MPPLALLLVGLLVAAACTREQAPPRVVTVRVVDDDQQQLADVPLELDGLPATHTGEDGTASISLSPSGPARARVGVTCPVHAAPAEPRHLARAHPGGSARQELSFVCRAKLRTLAVVARVPGGAGLTVRADGVPLGELDESGTLHALLTRAPGSELRLMVDTGRSPLLPQNPTRELRVGERDEILVFDQPLAAPPKPRARAPASPAKAPVEVVRAVPYAIRGPGY